MIGPVGETVCFARLTGYMASAAPRSSLYPVSKTTKTSRMAADKQIRTSGSLFQNLIIHAFQRLQAEPRIRALWEEILFTRRG